MNYYKRHIGDYAKKAGHLTPLEHGVYTLLLDAYYDRELAPTHAEAVRISRCRSADELAALEAVLADFFELVDDRYVQARVEEEFALAEVQAQKNQANGKRGGRPRKPKGNPKEPKGNPDETQSVSSGNPSESEKNPNPLIHQSNKEQEQGAPVGASLPATTKEKSVTLKTYLAECEAQGVQAIPADDPVFAYADKVGLPHEFLALSWFRFRRYYTEFKPTNRQANWRRHFLNAVKGAWGDLWRIATDGSYYLTTAGKQVETEAANAG